MKLIRLLKRDLASEVHDWVENGVISEEQGGQICARYGIDYRHPDEGIMGYRVLVVLGLLFIGLALLTLVGANWEDIPRWLRTTGLVLLVLAANLRGWFSYRAGARSAAVGWVFLGSLFYGSAIMLIAQIYHIGEHFPDGILWWALGVLPLALLLESGLLTALMLLLAFIWFFVETGQHFYPLWFPVFLAAAAYYLYRQGQSNVLFIGLIAGVGLFAEYTLSWFMADSPGFKLGQENVVLAGGLILLFQGLAGWLGSQTSPKAVDYASLLKIWVLRFFIIYLMYFSFSGPWDKLLDADWYILEQTLVLVGLLSLLAVSLVREGGAERFSVILASVIFWGLLGSALGVADGGFAVWFQVTANLLLVGVGVWLIVAGIRARTSAYFHMGVGVILLTGLLRYIDLVGDYLGATLLFAVFAVILLSAARFWKAIYRENAA